MICKLFYCETKHGNYCCAKCEYNNSCKNACLNKPKKCGSFLKPVNDVGFMKYVISENEKISAEVAECCDLIKKNSLPANAEFFIAVENLQAISVRIEEMKFELKKYLGVTKK